MYISVNIFHDIVSILTFNVKIKFLKWQLGKSDDSARSIREG